MLYKSPEGRGEAGKWDAIRWGVKWVGEDPTHRAFEVRKEEIE